MDAENADSVQLEESDDDDQVKYDDGSDEFENESDEDEKSVLYKPWAALDEEEQDAALNLGVLPILSNTLPYILR